MADEAKTEKTAGDSKEPEKKGGEESEVPATAEGVAAETTPQKKNLKKLILFIAIPLVLIIGICIFLFLTPPGKHLIGLDAKHELSEKEKKEAEAAKHVIYSYYDLPDILVNIVNPNSRRPIFLKLSVYLEIKEEKDKLALDKVKPRILDQFQVYLRGMRLEDLQGSAGIQRLRAELLHRAKEAAGSIEVNDVLFKEMLIQ